MPDLKSLFMGPPRRTLAVAESVTCGRLQALVGTISGASEFFLGGITAYTLDGKMRHLGVDRLAARQVNCVSEEVAEQMARGVCGLFGSDVGVATTGYAEPSAQWNVKEPFGWWAVAIRGSGVCSGRVECPGDSRAEAQQRIAQAACDALLSRLT